MLERMTYKALCTEFYELDKPYPPKQELDYYLSKAKEAAGPILEPMCGTGRILVPLLQGGWSVTGFDESPEMLACCRKKCREIGRSAQLIESSFQDAAIEGRFRLIIIPAGSLGLLVHRDQIEKAIDKVALWLDEGGQFIFEVETVQARDSHPGVWQEKRLNRTDGGEIVLKAKSEFDSSNHVETILCRYELWENGDLVASDLEELRIKLYHMDELDLLLSRHGLQVDRKLRPFTGEPASSLDKIVLYECSKRR